MTIHPLMLHCKHISILFEITLKYAQLRPLKSDFYSVKNAWNVVTVCRVSGCIILAGMIFSFDKQRSFSGSGSGSFCQTLLLWNLKCSFVLKCTNCINYKYCKLLFWLISFWLNIFTTLLARENSLKNLNVNY